MCSPPGYNPSLMKLILLLSSLLSLLTVQAQSLPIDFESGTITTASFVDFEGGVVTVVDNPQKTDANPSNKVGQLVRTGGAVFAGSKIILAQDIDLSTMSLIRMKVFTAAPVNTPMVIKLEGGGAASAEFTARTTVQNQWETLTWDLTGVPSTFKELVFLFDLGKVGDGSAASTFLFDDIQQASGGARVELPVTFEGTDINYGLGDFGGNVSSLVPDPTDPNNTVVQVIRSNTAETFAGTTIAAPAGFKDNVPFSVTATKMNVRVWSPTIGTPIRLKLEDSNDATRTVETEARTTVARTWETLEFDFSNQAPGTESLAVGLSRGWTYNKASIFFNFGATGASAGEQTYYFDDVKFGPRVVGVYDVRRNLTKVFPNPTQSEWILRTESTNIDRVELYDVVGRLLLNVSPNTTQVELPATQLPSGSYTARVTAGGGVQTVQLMRD